MLKSLIIILMSSVLVNNYVLSKFLGICPFLGVSKKLDQATGMGVAVTFVMLLATAVTWPIQIYVLNSFGLEYLQTIVFILVIATLVQFVRNRWQVVIGLLFQQKSGRQFVVLFFSVTQRYLMREHRENDIYIRSS